MTRRKGSVLAMAVVLLLALQMVAHGVLIMARYHLAASQAGVDLLRARHAAEAAALGRLGGEGSVFDPSTPAGDVVEGDASLRHGLHTGWRLRRLEREAWLVEGFAGPPGVRETVRVATVAWVLEPVARAAAFPGVVVVDPGAGLELAGSGVTAGAEACAGWGAALDSVRPAGEFPPVAWADSTAWTEPFLGLFGWAELADAAQVELTGTGSPEASWSTHGCDVEDPWNFGDPDNPFSPCSDHFVHAYAPGDVVVQGGTGQGLLVTPGDLVLDGHRFQGMLLVGGMLTLSGNSGVRGLVRAAGGLVMDPASAVVGSRCAAVEALAAVGERLSHPKAVPGAGWIAPLPQAGSDDF